MAEERIDALVDGYWREWEVALAGLGTGDHGRLNAAIGAVDTVWDSHLFEHAETFGGAEIGYARALSAAILGRLLDVDYAALASVAGSESTARRLEGWPSASVRHPGTATSGSTLTSAPKGGSTARNSTSLWRARAASCPGGMRTLTRALASETS